MDMEMRMTLSGVVTDMVAHEVLRMIKKAEVEMRETLGDKVTDRELETMKATEEALDELKVWAKKTIARTSPATAILLAGAFFAPMSSALESVQKDINA